MTKSNNTKKVVKGHNKTRPTKRPCQPVYSY
jgi:hypothetical protein